MFSSIIKSRLFASLVGLLAYGWLRLVKATTHFVVEPTNLDFLRNEAPIIVTTWHGQQLMVPVVYPGGSRLSALVSRSMDGEIITCLLYTSDAADE